MPDLHVLMPDQQPADLDNNVILTETMRPGRDAEYTITVMIDGKPISVGGPFLDLDEAAREAEREARHYALDPIYLRKEQA